MIARIGSFLLAALAGVALLVVVIHSRSLSSTVLAQDVSLADSIDNDVMAKVKADQLAQDRQTVADASKVNDRFGGSFSNGVGSNTWAGTPYAKYDDKDLRTESLAQMKGLKHAAKTASTTHASSKVVQARHKAHKAKMARASGKPSWFNAVTFDETPHKRAATVPEKMAFWEGIGSEHDKLKRAPSAGRSLRPISEAKAPTTMLLQDQPINARPYYTADSMGGGSEWNHYGKEVRAQNGGNPYAEGWAHMKPASSLGQLYGEISDQLQPLAQQYPYIRAIRH